MHYFSALLIATVMAVAVAEPVYKWVDDDGNVSYHASPPYSDGYQVEEKEFSEPESNSVDEAIQELARKHPVTLYYVENCSSCELARLYLRDRNIPFTEKNLKDDRKVQQEVVAKTGSLAVPVVTVGERVMNGFSQSLLEGELKQVGYPVEKKKAKKEEAEGVN